jgi:hypothetical protein
MFPVSFLWDHLAFDEIDKAVRPVANNRRKTRRIKPFAGIVAEPGGQFEHCLPTSCFLILLVQTPSRLAVHPHRLCSRDRRRKICSQREKPAWSRAFAALASAAEARQLRWNGVRFCFLNHRMNR